MQRNSPIRAAMRVLFKRECAYGNTLSHTLLNDAGR